MKIKVSEATDKQLNFMVAKAVGMIVTNHNGSVFWGNFATVTPTTSWSQGGPIIESERITVQTDKHDTDGDIWSAYRRENLFAGDGTDCWSTGPTLLVAGLRCFVLSKLGHEVEIPEELT